MIHNLLVTGFFRMQLSKSTRDSIRATRYDLLRLVLLICFRTKIHTSEKYLKPLQSVASLQILLTSRSEYPYC